jgi:hypothetical protein
VKIMPDFSDLLTDKYVDAFRDVYVNLTPKPAADDSSARGNGSGMRPEACIVAVSRESTSEKTVTEYTARTKTSGNLSVDISKTEGEEVGGRVLVTTVRPCRTWHTAKTNDSVDHTGLLPERV